MYVGLCMYIRIHVHEWSCSQEDKQTDLMAWTPTWRGGNKRRNTWPKISKTNSVASGFGRHGMLPPASNPDFWSFDLETCVWVASKVGNLPSKFWHARPLDSRIICYVRTDGRTKATLIALRLGHRRLSPERDKSKQCRVHVNACVFTSVWWRLP